MSMAQSTYVRTEMVGKAVVARLLVEKIAERESQVLQNELAAAAGPLGWRLAIDASEVTLLPSVGLGALVSMSKQCKAGGGKLVLFGLSAELGEVLKLTRLDRMIVIAPDREAALKALN